MSKQSDISGLITRIDKYLEAVDQARGTAPQLVKAAPLEIHLYNIMTHTKRELEGFRAMLKDANGTYLDKS